VGLPLYALQTGDFDPTFGGLGDVRVVPKLQLLDDRESVGLESVGLALVAELRIPARPERRFRKDSLCSWTCRRAR
jgi:OmpA-OmpF porin, OOP family